MRVVLVGLLALLFVSCNSEKKILLSQISGSEILEIVDYSPIYFFFDTKDRDTLIEVNKNNLISTTNWVFNIDNKSSAVSKKDILDLGL